MYRSIDPDGASWSTESHLLALVVDVLNVANWQRGAKKGTPRPRSLQRPGVQQPDRRTTRIGTASLSMEEMKQKQALWAHGTDEEVVETDGS